MPTAFCHPKHGSNPFAYQHFVIKTKSRNTWFGTGIADKSI
jgi:hypothetical protein